MQYFGFDRPSFAFKAYGFGESNPKLQADFTTGTYKADGASKTFADLFTFSRAGKAWLVKDTGLQEYAADVPRLDNGLLIEQSATNLLINSKDIMKNNVYAITSTVVGNALRLQSTETAPHIINYSGNQEIGLFTNSHYIKKVHENKVALFITPTGSGGVGIPKVDLTLPTLNILNQEETISTRVIERNGWSNIALTYNFKPGWAFRSITSNVVICDFLIGQMEQGSIATTPIITPSTPVTRPADFLLNKITGTTVTGDWDSTLTLSIVAGNLVHSGYGRIRSLEIN